MVVSLEDGSPDLMRPGDQDACGLLVCLLLSWIVRSVGISEANLLMAGCFL